ncbi:butyrophilin subfamily 1 member A1 isoform X4 [Oncorhynchus tshawytscha]|uniref:butyrophilin subfamily 1 member A1 isoform X4 n=2 Tax=Oncorhynchus tshawytscha TaxID=74940 RepID=UPI000D09C61D|nr:butyrophilin subfamily 1 member A1 isoform X4 [Oncorhynchus tshawytscha]
MATITMAIATIMMGCCGSKPEEQIESTVDSTNKEQENPLLTDTHLKLSPKKDASARSIKKTAKFDINQARSHEVDVTLDVDTAHPKLKIHGNSLQWTNESPQRKIEVENCFDEEPFVLGKMGSPLKTYWEVNVKEKDDWVLGVAKVTANRKGPLAFSPTNGFWVIRLSNGQRLKAMEDEEHVLDKGIPDKVGIYLDYQERKVTFFNAEEDSLIYSFINGPSYQDDVLPLFSPWNNDAKPITILPITAT